MFNLLPRAFSLRKWEGREKALVSAGRFCFPIGCLKCDNYCNLYANAVKLNFRLEMAVCMEVMPTKAFARNPICMFCSESKENRHVVRIFSKAGSNLEGCPSFRYLLPPSLIHHFMLIYYTHNFGVFFESCDRPMPGPFPALPILLGKIVLGARLCRVEKQRKRKKKRTRRSGSRLTLTPVFPRPFHVPNVISLVPTNWGHGTD